MEKVTHHSPFAGPGDQSQVCVTAQHEVNREDKTWTAEKYLPSPKPHSFSHSHHCTLQLHSSRTNSNDEEISVVNSTFSILHLC